MEWRTWLTDKVRELMYPGLVLCIIASLYMRGYAGEREYDAESGLTTAPLPRLHIRYQPADEPPAAATIVGAIGAATRPIAPSASVPVSD